MTHARLEHSAHVRSDGSACHSHFVSAYSAEHHKDLHAVCKANHSGDSKLHHHLPGLKLTDVEHEKSIVTDKHKSVSERLHAARQLLHEHINKFDYIDGKVHKQVSIEQNSHDGRLRVTETDKSKPTHASKIILEDTNHKSYTDKISSHNLMVAHHKPHHQSTYESVQGMHYHSSHMDSVGTYRQPAGAQPFHDVAVNPKYYQLSQNPDGSKTVNFTGCNVDTDGASRHAEDKCWQPHTSLRLSNGESLNTDLDNFVVLSPSLARALGVKLGDYGYLVDKATGRAVPVVFGDIGPEGKTSAEASVHAIKQLGRNERIDGNHGLSGQFQVVVVPHSGNRTGDIARTPEQIQLALNTSRTQHSA